jgi:predicted transcriptional regulator
MNSIGRIRVPQREEENYNTNTSTTSISQSNFNSNQISSTTNQLNLSQSRINTTTQNQPSSTNPAATSSGSNYENLKEKLNRMRIASKGTNNTQPPQQQ